MMLNVRPGAVRSPVVALLACAVLFVAAGCGKDSGVSVVGKVTVDGAPLPLGTVSFRPDASKGNTSPHEPGGQIDAEGNYRLYTQGKPGAPPGWYRVAVVAAEPIDPKKPYEATKSLVNAKYNSVDTSGLSREVVADAAPGAYDLNLAK